MENKIGLFYGSDTGMTEDISKDIIEYWDGATIETYEVCNIKPSDFDNYSNIIIGLSTWYDGDLQSDWEDFYDDFKTVDFTGKTVALYGLGDQIGYADYFADGVGILAKVILENGGNIIGNWSTEGYDYDESKADMGNGNFYGLLIDEDNQNELTSERIKGWLNILKTGFSKL